MTDLPTLLLLVCLVFCAALEQTISGFGFALIAMPLATLIVGIKIAAPLVALTGLTLYTINLLRYRQAINLHEIVRLGVAAALGVWGLVNLAEGFIKALLGFILIAYALFSFARPVTRPILSPRWGYLAGLVVSAARTTLLVHHSSCTARYVTICSFVIRHSSFVIGSLNH